MRLSNNIALLALLGLAGIPVLQGVFRNENTQALKDTNLNAFITAIRQCEGTADNDGFRRMFGGKLFSLDNGWTHPNMTNYAGKWHSTAAGAGQFIFSTWVRLKLKLGLSDFSPVNQILAMVELVKERGAYEHVIAGRIPQAVAGASKEWASLPGSSAGQHPKSMSDFIKLYTTAGGRVA